MRVLLIEDDSGTAQSTLMRLALLIVVVLVAAIPALAHSWYPVACCG